MNLAPRIYIPALMALIYLLNITSAQINESIAEKNNSTNGHVLNNQNYNIRAILDHIFISKENNSLKISETVILRNEGTEIHYSKDNHIFFSVSTPPEVENLKTQAMECCLVQEEGAVLMDPMQPIKHGDNFEMQVSYTLPAGSGYVFNKSVVYNTTSLLVFVNKQSGMSLEKLDSSLVNLSKKGNEPDVHQILTLQGSEYDVLSFDDLKAGEAISVPINMTEEPGYLYAVVGMVSLFSTGLVYRYKGKIFGKREKEYTLDELELEKKRIFQAIHGIERHAGTEKSEEYRRLIEEYRQRAIEISIKIDKIKN